MFVMAPLVVLVVEEVIHLHQELLPVAQEHQEKETMVAEEVLTVLHIVLEVAAVVPVQ